MKKLLLFISFSLFFLTGKSQNNYSYGKFNNKFFSITDFGSAAQIWTGLQAPNGMVYFGNDDEILSFNGIKWDKVRCDSAVSGSKLYNLVLKTKVCKLFKASDGRVFAGRENNFGYFDYSKKGNVIYKPLKAYSEDQAIGQIWNIFESANKEIIFIAERKIFIYANNKITEIPFIKDPAYSCKTSGHVGEGILLALNNSDEDDEDKKRKYLYYNYKTHQITDVNLPEHILIKSIRGTVLINGKWNVFCLGGIYSATIKNGKFIWNRENQNPFPQLKNYVINSVSEHNKLIYVSTEKDGVIITDQKGTIKRIFNFSDDLENTYVNDLFHDNENNLWLNLSNGIHFIETSSPITGLGKNEGIVSTIENIDFDSGLELLAYQTGILKGVVSNQHKSFASQDLVTEETYDVDTYTTSFGKTTLVIGYSGVFAINSAKKTIDTIAKLYAWTTYQNPLDKNEFFIGTESSLYSIHITENGWSEYKEVIPNVNSNVRKITSMGNNLYFGADQKGIYIYNLKTKQSKLIEIKHLSKSPFYLERFQNRIYIGAETGIFYLSNNNSKIVPFKEINQKFRGEKTLQIHRLYNENDKKLWVVMNREGEDKSEFETGWLSKNGRWEWTSWPLVGLIDGGISFSIKKSPDGSVWLGSSNGLYFFNDKNLKQINRKFKVSIQEVLINNKTVIFNPDFSTSLGDIEYKSFSNIKFYFAANSYLGLGNSMFSKSVTAEKARKMKYRYKFIGYDDDWSEWTDDNYTNTQKLSEGTYTIQIQAKNCYGFESEILKYNFTILPPWYRTWWAFTIYVISFFVLIYITIQLSIQRVKNQNIKLEATVKERTKEIAEQNTQLEVQKEEISQKTKDIVDSIVYAKRIQETILPTEDRLVELFKQHFVFYRPKDIVSGDFYWTRKKGTKIIFSAIDCTGHGVPGALVSIVGNSSLLRCVNEHKLTEPSEILDKHRDIVVKSFDSTGQKDVKDGMDMSICTLDEETLILKYAGANNECVIIRNKEIIELKPDKQPIGQFSHATPFTQQEIQLQEGDCIYQFTDGYVDQFGGDKGKKLKSRPFKEMLVEISHLSMDEQYKRVKECFENWKGSFDQVDDVCVFGIKI